MRNCIILLKATQTSQGPWRLAPELFPSANSERARHGATWSWTERTGREVFHVLGTRAVLVASPATSRSQRNHPADTAALKPGKFMSYEDFSPPRCCLLTCQCLQDSHIPTVVIPMAQSDAQEKHLLPLVRVYTEDPSVVGRKGLMREK